MQDYIWSIIGVGVFGAFVKVYWDVLQAYRSYRRLERAEARAQAMRRDMPVAAG